jgi:hypothetical protein
LRALFITDPRVDRQEIENRKDSLMDDSCEWIVDNPSFQETIDSDDDHLLWIHGEPGKGKTMIAMFLVDLFTAKFAGYHHKKLCYFFCDNTTDKRNTTLNALMSIVHQVLKQCSKNVLLEDFQSQGAQMFSSVEAVWICLMRVLASSTFSTVQIVIDGLDECDRDSLDSFLSLVTGQFSKRAKGQYIVKWILTSRNEVAIREYLGPFPDLDLEGNSAQVSEAVDAFINAKVDELAARKRYDEALKLFVVESLREKAEGTFLWVSLACTELRKRNVSSINTRLVLGKLPPGLSRLYSRILDQVMDNDMEEMVELALEILLAVTIAIRPLNFGELAVVSGLPFEARESSEVSRQYAEQCGSFLTFRDDFVYLVHQSAKDYLVKHQQAALYPQSLLAEHQKVAHRCLDYVAQDWQEDVQNRKWSSDQSI